MSPATNSRFTFAPSIYHDALSYTTEEPGYLAKGPWTVGSMCA